MQRCTVLLAAFVPALASEGSVRSKNGSIALLFDENVASALVELLSKHIIHRDIKSANILIDLDIKQRADGTPVVKVSDFDRAVLQCTEVNLQNRPTADNLYEVRTDIGAQQKSFDIRNLEILG